MPNIDIDTGCWSRSDLERDSLAHPGFAHVARAVLLDHVHSGLAHAIKNAPQGAEVVYFRAATFSYIASLLGIVCCLCGTVREARQGFRTSLPFCKWLCGSFDGTCLADARTHPLCVCCNSRVIMASRASNTPRSYVPHILPVLTESQFPEVLCSIYRDRPFRTRVEANAGTFSALRFDPRQRQPLGQREAA